MVSAHHGSAVVCCVKGCHSEVVGVLITYTHVCLLLETSITDVDSATQTAPCEVLEKETFWKVAHVVCTLLL